MYTLTLQHLPRSLIMADGHRVFFQLVLISAVAGQLPTVIIQGDLSDVSQVCAAIALALCFVVLPLRGTTSSPVHFARTSWAGKRNGFHRAADDGPWYNFSRPPLFVFYVYSAFLVDYKKSQDVIRLVAISSPVELFARRQLDVHCLVRYRDNSTYHASMLRPPPHRILTPGAVMGYGVGDYTYSCPLPEHRGDRVPVRILANNSVVVSLVVVNNDIYLYSVSSLVTMQL